MTINFNINKQELSTQFNQKVVADSRNYLIAKFNFTSSEWDRIPLKIALFTYNGQTYKKILGSDENCDMNECYIPPEVIHSPRFSVSIYGGDRITTNSVKINVEPSGYTENIINEKPTQSTLIQMEYLMQKYALICNNILQDCKKLVKEE